MMNKNFYIIVTPAKNEEKYIENTIKSVINQTIKPIRWVIVDDGSTDATAEIVKKYLKDYPFIKLIRRETNTERHFGNKVFAIKSGLAEVRDLHYEYFCNLDADVSFENDYFESLLNKFAENPKLGICGGRAYNPYKSYLIQQKYADDSVPGFTQFFRKTCYEQTGGYIPFKYGNEDGYIEIKAKSLGWEVRTFDDIKIIHHRLTGSEWGGLLKLYYISGKIEYYYCFYYPYHLLRSIKIIFNKPFLIGSIAKFIGFFSSLLSKEKRIDDENFINFIKNYQKKKLINNITSVFYEKT